jgi:hypothetical protein
MEGTRDCFAKFTLSEANVLTMTKGAARNDNSGESLLAGYL